MVEIAIGIGIVLSLVLTETVGVTAGGVIVPGYIALYLHEPVKILSTFFVSYLVFLIVWGLSKSMMIYGKRRLVLCLLLGFFLGYLSKLYFRNPVSDLDLSVIGSIIPGLIASWMDRQGVIRTLSVVVITASIVQLCLMVLSPETPHV